MSLSGGIFLGGMFSGIGVIDDGNGFIFSFDFLVAGVGMYIIIYFYIDVNGCINSVEDQIIVFVLLNVGFVDLGDFCVDVGV